MLAALHVEVDGVGEGLDGDVVRHALVAELLPQVLRPAPRHLLPVLERDAGRHRERLVPLAELRHELAVTLQVPRLGAQPRRHLECVLLLDDAGDAEVLGGAAQLGPPHGLELRGDAALHLQDLRGVGHLQAPPHGLGLAAARVARPGVRQQHVPDLACREVHAEEAPEQHRRLGRRRHRRDLLAHVAVQELADSLQDPAALAAAELRLGPRLHGVPRVPEHAVEGGALPLGLLDALVVPPEERQHRRVRARLELVQDAVELPKPQRVVAARRREAEGLRGVHGEPVDVGEVPPAHAEARPRAHVPGADRRVPARAEQQERHLRVPEQRPRVVRVPAHGEAEPLRVVDLARAGAERHLAPDAHGLVVRGRRQAAHDERVPGDGEGADGVAAEHDVRLLAHARDVVEAHDAVAPGRGEDVRGVRAPARAVGGLG
mmetsp:Transcript_40650/g.127193  ORF Transcript_40650/g.127193 Transcript_40650/m.127193 type:complete len:433 (+) Transcript_40650:1669-2967(+)